MDTAWIQVFVLVFSQCAAPPGKTVCQEEENHYQFSSRDDCEQMLETPCRQSLMCDFCQ